FSILCISYSSLCEICLLCGILNLSLTRIPALRWRTRRKKRQEETGMKLAILGAGNIANMMAEAARGTEGVTLYAVASRSLERARAFAEKWGFEKAYGS